MATTTEVAEQFGTDGKTLRKFFRSDATEIEPVGQGSRYEIDDDDLELLEEQFNAWVKGKVRKANPATEDGDEEPKPKKSRKTKAKPEPEVLEDEDLELDEEPSDDDLAEIDDELDELSLDEEEEPEEAPAPKAKSRRKK